MGLGLGLGLGLGSTNVHIHVYTCIFYSLLGRGEVSMRDVVSKGRYSPSITLKGKKGDVLKVCTCVCLHQISQIPKIHMIV